MTLQRIGPDTESYFLTFCGLRCRFLVASATKKNRVEAKRPTKYAALQPPPIGPALTTPARYGLLVVVSFIGRVAFSASATGAGGGSGPGRTMRARPFADKENPRKDSRCCLHVPTRREENPSLASRFPNRMPAARSFVLCFGLLESMMEWERPKAPRRPDIFPQFSPMKTPLPHPLPEDPPEEDEEEEEEQQQEGEENPEEEDAENPDQSGMQH
ncbi:hypothetical protein ZIOFF_029348 [Zingiber officinale]|uniref:Uncharacterized protein n=1 Tax=Zingiber officinale TaxID=94328 RepID=A0A8J5LAS7_ZINOF|nr:hypothetical protein ZIOFF_029348 [Zingiber officinale]